MKAKILYTNGDRIIELFWVKHTGTDVYCGMSGTNEKRSYHASGKLHTKGNDQERDGVWVSPLKEVQGQFHLNTIGLTNTRRWSEGAYEKMVFTGRKLDTVLYVDARSIPEKQFINISVGLLEPNNLPVLQGLIAAIGDVKQVLLATETTPWIYCMLIWPVNIGVA